MLQKIGKKFVISQKKIKFKKRIFLLTLGTLSALHTPSDNNLSRISHAKILGHSRLYSDTFPTTPGVATLGFEPPIALGFIEPVS